MDCACRFALCMLGAIGMLSQPVRAEPTFAGKTITFYVGGGIGGGVDAFARAIAPYLAKHLPGSPAISISNMGASGGLQGVQYVYNVAPKDGTAFGTTNAGPISEPLMGQIRVNYDIRRFRWIGSLTRGDTVCAVWHASSVRTLDDARAMDVAMSSTGATSAPTRSALLMNHLLGPRFKPVPGYDGGTSLIAIERGEVDGTCTTLGSLRTTRPEWIRQGALLQVALEKDPEFPDVPGVADLVRDESQRKLLEWFLIPYEFNNPLFLPPGTSDDILNAYRQAFKAAVSDPDYLQQSAILLQKVRPHTGIEVEQLVGQLLDADPQTIRAVIDATDLKIKK